MPNLQLCLWLGPLPGMLWRSSRKIFTMKSSPLEPSKAMGHYGNLQNIVITISLKLLKERNGVQTVHMYKHNHLFILLGACHWNLSSCDLKIKSQKLLWERKWAVKLEIIVVFSDHYKQEFKKLCTFFSGGKLKEFSFNNVHPFLMAWAKPSQALFTRQHIYYAQFKSSPEPYLFYTSHV